jgi:tetratricopeptide (TPR) repeat protein
LERVLASPEFSASDQRRKFLRFVVEEAVAGRAQGLKGVVIAHEVFRRDADFNSKSDPVVRLEARRLRRDLDSYYIGPGRDDPVRIAIPKGGYAPEFVTLHHAPETPEPQPPEVDLSPPTARRRGSGGTLAIAILLVLLTGVGVGLLLLQGSDDTATATVGEIELPRVAILPFQALDPSETTHALAAGIGSELLHYLSQFQGLRLYAPSVENLEAQTLAELGKDPVPSYLVRGEVLTENNRASVVVKLLNAGSGELVWSDIYDLQLSPGSLIDLRDSASVEIASALGQPYGALSENIRSHSDSPPPANLESYLCVQEGYSYRRTFDRAGYELVLECLEAAVARNPGYSDAWAMLGWVRLDASRYRFVPPDRVDANYAAALSAAERAYGLDPNNVLTLKALSTIHHHMGQYEEGERFGWRALELNPNDPDTLAQVGWRLAARGKFDEGVPLMERSLERTVDPPAWYYHLLSMYHFLEGDAAKALELAEHSANKGSGFGNFLVAVAAGTLGYGERAKSALEGIDASSPLAADPAAFMRSHGATDEIVEKMVSGYTEAQRLVSDLLGAEPASGK